MALPRVPDIPPIPWARAPKDSDADSHRIILQVYNPKTGRWDSQGTGIRNTTCSPAYRAIAGRLYKACAKASILGGSPATCTGAWRECPRLVTPAG